MIPIGVCVQILIALLVKNLSVLVGALSLRSTRSIPLSHYCLSTPSIAPCIVLFLKSVGWYDFLMFSLLCRFCLFRYTLIAVQRFLSPRPWCSTNTPNMLNLTVTLCVNSSSPSWSRILSCLLILSRLTSSLRPYLVLFTGIFWASRGFSLHSPTWGRLLPVKLQRYRIQVELIGG